MHVQERNADLAFEWEDRQRKRAQKHDQQAFIAQLEASDNVHDRIKAIRFLFYTQPVYSNTFQIQYLRCWGHIVLEDTYMPLEDFDPVRAWST